MTTIAIVGSGAAGIVSGKVLLQDGFDVTVFDRQSELGGIWSSEGTFYDLHTQQPGPLMEFADLYDGEDDLKDVAKPWHLVVRKQDDTVDTLSFDRLVIATGLHSNPNRIEFKGQERFFGSSYPGL
ncbi:unnamed protein product [Didymodactylos carnosus]|uniref:FAD/NAD(P)-binding domain-containing protein n=1 Tax=Didymodactylos carnosus TaxID=1234261 RepID=A0A8S2V8S6_9BILA|nr:unnamed protein product [Didymodactylos carnosus]CAF4385777.1 unnamed protein product [Didymodactylos carnosus]